MGFFITHLIFWAAVEVIFDPGVIVIKVGDAPTVVYDKNDKSWAVPSYNNLKTGLTCLERNNIKCLRGRR